MEIGFFRYFWYYFCLEIEEVLVVTEFCALMFEMDDLNMEELFEDG